MADEPNDDGAVYVSKRDCRNAFAPGPSPLAAIVIALIKMTKGSEKSGDKK